MTDCLGWVTLDQDPNDDRIFTFHDGELHYLRAERYNNTGYIYVDTQHKGWRLLCRSVILNSF